MKRLESIATTAQTRQHDELDIWCTALLSGLGLAAAIAVPAAAWLDWDAAMSWMRVAAVVLVLPLLVVAVLGLVAVTLAGIERLSRREAETEANDIRLIPVHRREPTLDGLDPRDLRYFVEQLGAVGDPSQANWRGKRMPSGRNCDNDYHALLCSAVGKTGHLQQPDKARQKRRLIDFGVEHVLADLGLGDEGERDTAD